MKRIIASTALFVSAAAALSALAAIPPQQQQADIIPSVGETFLTQHEEGIGLASAEIPVASYAAEGVPTTAQDAYKVTATVKTETGDAPENYQLVDFSLGWMKEIAQPVTDYLSMETTDNTATVSVLKGFSAQILLTAKSRLDPSKQATVTFDYAPSLIGYNIMTATSLVENGYDQTENAEWYTVHTVNARQGETPQSVPLHLANNTTHTNTMPSGQGSWEADVIVLKGAVWDTVGTVENTVTDASLTVKLADQFWQKFHYVGKPIEGGKALAIRSSVGQYDLLMGMIAEESQQDVKQYLGVSATVNPDLSMYHYFFDPLDEIQNVIEATLSLTLKYGGTVSFSFCFDVSVQSEGVDRVETNTANHVFS